MSDFLKCQKFDSRHLVDLSYPTYFRCSRFMLEHMFETTSITVFGEFNQDDLVYCSITSTILVIYYSFARRFITSNKGRAWLITTLVGVFTSLASLNVLSKCILQGFTLKVFDATDGMSNAALHVFRSYCVVDLFVGVLDYRDQLSLLTTWIHHVVYAWLMTSVLNNSVGNAMVIFFLEEVPTVILGLGYIEPSWRSDFGFGGTFLILRLFFHVVLLSHFLVWRHHHVLGWYWPCVAFSLILHMHWFYSWYIGMQKRGWKKTLSSTDLTKLSLPIFLKSCNNF
mmetsp:Transcript_31352/g.43497  ORF Transcript_31352/g.43497 Transcript_31352/m.43497 type:complete len:283 (+) Transcript_31352:106-954(+)